jgi:hypothetical protein
MPYGSCITCLKFTGIKHVHTYKYECSEFRNKCGIVISSHNIKTIPNYYEAPLISL